MVACGMLEDPQVPASAPVIVCRPGMVEIVLGNRRIVRWAGDIVPVRLAGPMRELDR
jgi:hypothetical protein